MHLQALRIGLHSAMQSIKQKLKSTKFFRKIIGKYHKTSIALTALIVPARGPVFITSGNRSVEII